MKFNVNKNIIRLHNIIFHVTSSNFSNIQYYFFSVRYLPSPSKSATVGVEYTSALNLKNIIAIFHSKRNESFS